jgi:hypothetical protein
MNTLKHHLPHNEKLREDSLLLDRIFDKEDAVIDFFYSGGIHNTRLVSAYLGDREIELHFIERINGEERHWECDATRYEMDMCLGGAS